MKRFFLTIMILLITGSILAGGQMVICEDFAGGDCTPLEDFSKGFVTANIFQWHVANGTLFCAAGVTDTVNIADPEELQITTGANPIFLRYEVTANKSSTIYLIKDITADNTGVTVTPRNYNQVSVNTTNVLVFNGPATVGGTTLNSQAIGIGDFSDFGGVSDGLHIGWVMPANKTWLLRLDALEDETRMGWGFDFFEITE